MVVAAGREHHAVAAGLLDGGSDTFDGDVQLVHGIGRRVVVLDRAARGAPTAASCATVSATPEASSAKPRSASTLTGTPTEAVSAATWVISSSRVTSPSCLPSDHARPELVVASASKCSASRTAEPTSHGFGTTNSPSACSSRNRRRVWATEGEDIPASYASDSRRGPLSSTRTLQLRPGASRPAP
jgi:hypothetical protein